VWPWGTTPDNAHLIQTTSLRRFIGEPDDSGRKTLGLIGHEKLSSGIDARSIPRIRIPGEHTRDRSVLVGKLAEVLKDQRPTRKVTAMFIDMAFGSPIYERLRALGLLSSP
jgi:hypothetical protein